MPDIIPEHFNHGQDHYRSGGSVFALVNKIRAEAEKGTPDSEIVSFSLALGFLEAVVGDIRVIADRTRAAGQ